MNWHMYYPIVDFRLISVDGLNLCQRIRQKNRSLPVLMLTIFGSIRDKVEGFGAGADDYIPIVAL